MTQNRALAYLIVCGMVDCLALLGLRVLGPARFKGPSHPIHWVQIGSLLCLVLFWLSYVLMVLGVLTWISRRFLTVHSDGSQ